MLNRIEVERFVPQPGRPRRLAYLTMYLKHNPFRAPAKKREGFQPRPPLEKPSWGCSHMLLALSFELNGADYINATRRSLHLFDRRIGIVVFEDFPKRGAATRHIGRATLAKPDPMSFAHSFQQHRSVLMP